MVYNPAHYTVIEQKQNPDKELVKRQECIETDDEIQNYQEKLTDLQQKYNSLQGIMFPQKKNEPTAADVSK